MIIIQTIQTSLYSAGNVPVQRVKVEESTRHKWVNRRRELSTFEPKYDKTNKITMLSCCASFHKKQKDQQWVPWHKNEVSAYGLTDGENYQHLSQKHDKTNKITMSLYSKAGHSLMDTHWTHEAKTDRAIRIPRLIWIFFGHTVILLVLPCRLFHQCTLSYPLSACREAMIRTIECSGWRYYVPTSFSWYCHQKKKKKKKGPALSAVAQ